VRLLAISLWLLLATITASACGGSTAGAGSQTAGAPLLTSATRAAPLPTTTAAAATTYHTHLERTVAQAFESAYLATPAAPTESQIPPKINLLVRKPPTVCRPRRPAVYRCSVTYQLPAEPHPLRVTYEVHRRHGCFTATAAAIARGNTLHRLSNC
jgi:hypothetical protein